MSSRYLRLALCALASAAPRTAAAETVPLSALGTVRPRIDRGTVTLPRAAAVTYQWNDGSYAHQFEYAMIAAPLCFLHDFVSDDDRPRGERDLDKEVRDQELARDDEEVAEIERLVTQGETAELESTRVTFDAAGELKALGRVHLALRPIVRLADGLVVYAYRAGKRVFVIAPTTEIASVRHDSSNPDSSHGLNRAEACGYAITQLEIQGGSSGVAQISGTAARRPYRIDASLSKTSRDPEPLLSVTARFTDSP